MTESRKGRGKTLGEEESAPKHPIHGFGLKDEWQSVEDTLLSLIPVYDRTNRYISLGSDLRLREAGLGSLRRALGFDSFSIVDLGCGPGKMAQLLSSKASAHFILTDALLPMMRVAKGRNSSAQGVVSVFESLPFRSESFDAAMAGFAIRDARDLTLALREILTILKPGGFFLVVDLCKPDGLIRRGVIALYWRLFAPLIAFFAAGRLGLKFAALSTTFRKLPKNSELERLIVDTGFEIQQKEYHMLGGACILLLKKS